MSIPLQYEAGIFLVLGRLIDEHVELSSSNYYKVQERTTTAISYERCHGSKLQCSFHFNIIIMMMPMSY